MFQNIRITTKYPVVIVALALCASVLTGVLAYSTTSSELQMASGDKLKALLETRKTALENYFATIDEDLRIQSQNPVILKALDRLSSSWHDISGDRVTYFQKHYITDNPFPAGEKEMLNSATDGSLYSQYHLEYHPIFRSLREERGYYDIFLFDDHGDLVYTVVKEKDYATNLESGPWKDTNLGRAFRAIKDANGNTGQFFFDFEQYEPSQKKPASFIANALFGPEGDFLGVLAFQLPIDRLNAVMQVSAGMGETGEAIIVGRDYLRRSDSRFLDQSLILQQKIDNSIVRSALRGEMGVGNYENAAGESVFAAYDYIDFQDVRWALLAEVEEAEILAPIKRMKQAMIIGFIFIAIAVTLVGITVSKSLAHPILRMTEAMTKLSVRDFTTDIVPSQREDEIGGMERALLVFRDNAIERSKADAKFVEQTMLLKVVIENVAHGIALYDRDGRLMVWNRRYIENVGLDNANISKGTDFTSLAVNMAKRGIYGPGDPLKLAKERLSFLRENEETKSELAFQEGEICEVVSKRTPDGGFVVAYTDVTRDRKYQKEILRQRDDLHHLNQQKNRFFSIIAHDLRNPFNALLGYSDYLQQKVGEMSSDQLVNYAGSIHLAGQQAYDLLENLLEWSRVQMNQTEFAPQDFEIEEVLRKVVDDLATVISDKGLKVIVDTNSHLLRGDLNMTSTVLRNLIGNAIKFTKRGGEIEVTCEDIKGHLHIYVQDNGIGMNSEALASLFNIEVNQSTTGTDGETGTGLGLLICKDFAEKQGGKIQVSSKENEGTMITFILPKADEK